MKIAFLTSGHSSFDDRIYWHQAVTLAQNGHKVLVISSKEDIRIEEENISVDSFNGESLSKRKKIITFTDRLKKFNPDIAICSEPLPLISAREIRNKTRNDLRIIYDITEWYPSKRFLGEFRPPFRWFGFLKLLFINIYASSAADAFIFGEKSKGRPYRFFFPLKPFRIITYYPDLQYIHHIDPSLQTNRLRLSYSGEICMDKGFGNFLKVIYGLSDRNKDLEINVKLVAWYPSENDRKECESLIRHDRQNIKFSFIRRQDFRSFTGVINDTDIFIDLRKVTFISNCSLPIKLFYYAALGRPVIISDLKVIRRETLTDQFGFLVDPDDTDEIIRLISRYLIDPGHYNSHCSNALRLSAGRYNWGKILPEFLEFIGSPRN